MPNPQEPGAAKDAPRPAKGTPERAAKAAAGDAAKHSADPAVKRPSHHALKQAQVGAGKGSSRTAQGTPQEVPKHGSAAAQAAAGDAAKHGAAPSVKRPSHHALRQAPGDAAPGTPARHGRRPVEKSGGIGRLAAVLVVVVLAVISAVLVLKELRLADRTYWEEFQKAKLRIDRTEEILPAEVLRRVQALPTQGVQEPALLELHQAWLEFAEAMQDEKEFTKNGAELRQRFHEAHIKAARVMGGQAPAEPAGGGTGKPFKPLQP